MMAATKLQAVRRLLDQEFSGYSADAVITMLLTRAQALNLAVMSPASLKTKLSRWENGHEAISQPVYRRLFREIYGRTNEELGFPPEIEDEEAAELESRLTIARTVDAETVNLFRQQVETARHVDRRFGGITVLDQLRSNIKQMSDLLNYSTLGGQREHLAGVLTEAAALAGWEALDRTIRQAWDLHERAKAAAREAGSPLLLAHATAQQAFILIDIGKIDWAIEQLAEARTIANQSAPPLLLSWLAAGLGEGLAAAGRRDDALRAFDTAATLLPNDPEDPALPFLFLAGAHLERWRGHALSRLGEPDAIDQLSSALPRLPSDFTRARTSMLVDLAYAYAASGDRDAARTYAQQARRLALQIKSDRQLRRLHDLVLPAGATAAA
jgi:tetratricopeptide (TPR) repeat protein